MLASLLLAVAIPEGFGEHALLFACGYSGLQIGAQRVRRRGHAARLVQPELSPDLEFPRFRGHLIAGPSGPAWRISVHAIDPAVFVGVPS
jgi:hypothetical protein